MPVKDAKLLLPRPALADLIACVIVRDTRARELTPQERFSFYPASPLCGVAWAPVGKGFAVDEEGRISAEPVPSVSFFGAMPRPNAGWTDGPAFGAFVILFPEAWRTLSGREAGAFRERIVPLNEAMGPELASIFCETGWEQDCEATFARLQDALTPLWSQSLGPTGSLTWLSDWVRRLSVSAARVGPRQFQRRIKGWTGRAHRDLAIHARAEALFARSQREPGKNFAEMAASMGYADQSHMIREVKRVTGHPPGKILELIATDERFWCYRLMAEHFRGA